MRQVDRKVAAGQSLQGPRRRPNLVGNRPPLAGETPVAIFRVSWILSFSPHGVPQSSAKLMAWQGLKDESDRRFVRNVMRTVIGGWIIIAVFPVLSIWLH